MCIYIIISDCFCWAATVLQLAFGFLEAFKWRGLAVNTFGMSKDQANATASIAAQMGAYNAFIAISFVIGQITHSRETNFIFLGGMFSMAVFGSITVKSTIIFSQGLVPFLGLFFLLLANLITDECKNCGELFGWSMGAAAFFAMVGIFWNKRESSFQKPVSGSLSFSGV